MCCGPGRRACARSSWSCRPVRCLPGACLIGAPAVHMCSPSWQHARMVETLSVHGGSIARHPGHTCRQVWHQGAVDLQGVAMAESLALIKSFSWACRPGEGRLIRALPVRAGRQRGTVHRSQLRWGQPPAALGAGVPLARWISGWPMCSRAEEGDCPVAYHGFRILLVQGSCKNNGESFTGACCTGDVD